jgi:hypothetical protein
MHGVYHTILGGANIGVLVLATAAFFLRLIMGRRQDRLADMVDAIAWGSALTGVGIAIFSGLSGFFATWPMEAIRQSLLTQNKVMVTLALLGAWGLFLVLRWRFGMRIWHEPLLALWCAFLVVVGFINTVLVGSMGGSASLKGTALDPALLTLNINRYIGLDWGPWISLTIIIVSIAFAGGSWFLRRQTRVVTS